MHQRCNTMAKELYFFQVLISIYELCCTVPSRHIWQHSITQTCTHCHYSQYKIFCLALSHHCRPDLSLKICGALCSVCQATQMSFTPHGLSNGTRNLSLGSWILPSSLEDSSGILCNNVLLSTGVLFLCGEYCWDEANVKVLLHADNKATLLLVMSFDRGGNKTADWAWGFLPRCHVTQPGHC